MGIARWLWGWRDRRRQRKIEQAAFADERFVLYLHVNGRLAPICFTPRESEARGFFGNYVLPWMQGELPWLSHQGWTGLPGVPRSRSGAYMELYRGYDLRAIRLLAPSQVYQDRLDNLLSAMLREASATAEANRVAEKASAHSAWVATIRDASRGIGGEDGRR